MKPLENIKAQKLLNKIQRDLMRNGIITNTLIEDLKELRTYVVDEGQPLLAKVIRLTFEHVEEYQSFNIAIPEDDPIEDDEENQEVRVEDEVTGQESLAYLFSLMEDHTNKVNEIELRDYIQAFTEYAEEN
ncbi:hypothetical protein [Zunongwangia atlantica]|uniref:Uncharacterized protein n=1 Tax=Zunongwangia atlantica 22II14-10F7 TaxID=1185767 RepID=A0A1Y1T7Z5_9FLAO|nr:hypothetical protein [Zunongwangia atlantica]ORL46543.1 hypothetical protein IIF7_05847 [Zunongwangia atlantica 22II14-10F7]